MPDHGLKRLGMGSNGQGIGGWYHQHPVTHFFRVTAIAPHNAEHFQTTPLALDQGANNIGADVALGIAPARVLDTLSASVGTVIGAPPPATAALVNATR